LLQAVAQAYIATQAARAQVEVLAASAVALRREAEIAVHRLQAGDVSSAEQAQIEIAASQDELNAETQRAAATASAIALETLLATPHPEGNVQLADPLPQLAPATALHLEDATVAARPDIVAAEALLGQAEANLTLQRRQRIPDVTVSVQYERNPPYQTDTVGMGLSVPLPVLNHYSGEIRNALAARGAAQAQLDKVRLQAAADVAAARVAYREAASREQRYQSALVPQSTEVVRRVTYAYEKGGATLVDLLEAERNDNGIRFAAVQAQADDAAAAVTLRASLGQLK
jgi:cobalt-zinc-cadmium efflux system outer membrane protein